VKRHALAPHQHIIVVNFTMFFFTRTWWAGKEPDTGHHSFEDAVSGTQSIAEIAIFWDYENMQVPGWCSAAKASECIRKNVQSHGRIIERKLYFDSSKTTQQPLERSVLDLSGFSLVDCPSRNNKETVDKKIIVDMLCFAHERVFSKGSNVHIVLITSDGDYAYTLARLRDIGVTTVVIYSPDCVANILISSADEALTWEDDILGGSPSLQNPTERNATEAPTTTTTATTKALDFKKTLLFLRIVLAEQEPHHPWWIMDSRIGSAFHSRSQSGVPDKEAYRSAKTDAIQRRYVEIGRQDLTQTGTPIVTSPYYKEGRSLTTYLRLTALGRLKLQGH
jgi:hypothetical protein